MVAKDNLRGWGGGFCASRGPATPTHPPRRYLGAVPRCPHATAAADSPVLTRNVLMQRTGSSRQIGLEWH